MQELFNNIVDIGEQMLVSGAEVHRAEESIERMGKAVGAERTDVFIITSSMVVSFYMENGEHITQTRRIKNINTDYEVLHRLNNLSRDICSKNLTAKEIKNSLNNAVNGKRYSFWAECFAYSAIAGAFTLFFGGGLIEMIVSMFVGLIVRFGILLSDKTVGSRVFSKFISVVISTILAIVSVKIGIIESVDKIIIGNIMTLVPGIGLTNALRDLFTGDSIAGILRFVEAVLTAIAIAAGYILPTYLWTFFF